MANYYSATRTNYFHVKDRAKFLEMMTHVIGNEDSVETWEETDKNGNSVFAFGCYGNILGYVENDDDDVEYEDAYEKFIELLKENVASGDAIIIFESGHEKLKYVSGLAVIITEHDVDSVYLHDTAIEKAGTMLKNPDYNTCCEY